MLSLMKQESILNKLINSFKNILPKRVTKKTVCLYSDYPQFFTKDNLEYLLNCNDIRIYEQLFRDRRYLKKII